MPLITLTVVKPKSAEFKSGIFAAVHAALVASGMPATDRFQRVLALDAEDFRFDQRYPDLSSDRDQNFALIEILFSEGRSVKVKKKIVADILASLTAAPSSERGKRDDLFQGNTLGKLSVWRRRFITPSRRHANADRAKPRCASASLFPDSAQRSVLRRDDGNRARPSRLTIT